jgi:hypothetical protein
MIDPHEYTEDELAGLYFDMLSISLYLRLIICVGQMDVLRCETPEMVMKKSWMHAHAGRTTPVFIGSVGDRMPAWCLTP